MSIAAHIKASLELPVMVVNSYLADLKAEDLLVRPLDNMNHIAWQLGHLIWSENYHVRHVCPDAVAALPEAFRDQHSRETAASNDAADFLSKDEYLAMMETQRNSTLSALDGLCDDDLMQPSPEAIRYFGPTVGSVFAGEAAHWLMHAGQWAVIRRKLGHPPLF